MQTTRAQRAEAHRSKMQHKRDYGRAIGPKRGNLYQENFVLRRTGPGVRIYGKTSFDVLINRHTGKPHEHRREIARRLRQHAASAA